MRVRAMQGPSGGADHADIFLTYCTNALAAQKENLGQQIVNLPDNLAVGADYGLTVIIGSSPVAQQFANFIMSPEGQAIFRSTRQRGEEYSNIAPSVCRLFTLYTEFIPFSFQGLGMTETAKKAEPVRMTAREFITALAVLAGTAKLTPRKSKHHRYAIVGREVLFRPAKSKNGLPGVQAPVFRWVMDKDGNRVKEAVNKITLTTLNHDDAEPRQTVSALKQAATASLWDARGQAALQGIRGWQAHRERASRSCRAVSGCERQVQKRRPTPAPPAEGGWRKVARWRAAPLHHCPTPFYKGGGLWCGAADGGRVGPRWRQSSSQIADLEGFLRCHWDEQAG